MPQFYRTNREMITENTLAFLAQQKIEEVKSTLTDDFDAVIDLLPGTFYSADFPDGADYHYLISTPVADDSRADLVVVTVQVWYCYGSIGSYDDAENRIQLITKIANRA